MARRTRPQMHRLSWPLTPEQVEGLDSMIEELFKSSKRHDDATGGDTSVTLDDISDVVLTSPLDGDVLSYDSGSGTWVNTPVTSLFSLALDDLSDVVISAVADNQFLRYDSGTSKWVNETVSIVAAPFATPRIDWWVPVGCWAFSQSNGDMTGIGGLTGAKVSSGTANLVNDTKGSWIRLVTGAVSTNTARFNSSVSTTAIRIENDGTFVAVVRTGADITNVRIFVGLYNTNGIASSDTPSGDYAMFRYSTTAGDGGWVGVTDDGGAAPTVTSTIATIAANTVYVLKMRIVSGTPQIFFSVNGSAEQSSTTNQPDNSPTAEFTPIAQIETRTTAAKTLDAQSLMYYKPAGGLNVLGSF